MWLITYSQRSSPGGHDIIANTVLNTDCTPAVWLAGALTKWPDAGTKLLFALEITDEEGTYLREHL